MHVECFGYVIHFNRVSFAGNEITAQRNILLKITVNLRTHPGEGSLDRYHNVYHRVIAGGFNFFKSRAAIAQAALYIDKDLHRVAFRKSYLHLVNRRGFYLQTCKWGLSFTAGNRE